MPQSLKVVINSNIWESIQVFTGACESLSYQQSSNSNLEVTDVNPGDQFYIKWSTNGSHQDFTWTLSEQEFVAGDVCSDPLQAEESENQFDSDGGDVWYTFTMPNQVSKKLVITSDDPIYFQVLSGDCENPQYHNGGYYDVWVGDLAPGQQALIRLNTTNAGSFSWELATEDLAPGESCAGPESIVIDGENFVPETSLNEFWFDLTMPEGDAKKLVVTSDSNHSFDVLSGTCESFVYHGWYNESGEIISLQPGQHIWIRWNTYQGNFPFTVSFEDFDPGENCAAPAQAVVGENNLVADGLYNYYYRFTMPEDGYNKLIVTSNEDLWVYMESDLCSEPGTIIQGYSGFTTDILSPGQTVTIRWNVNANSDFSWYLGLEEVEEGETCVAAIESVAGINNTSEAPKWFTFTMPGTGDVTVSSAGLTNSNTYLKVYNNGCAGGFSTNDNFNATLQSQIALNNVAGGTTIKILWDDLHSSAGFDWSMQLANVSQTITFNSIPEKTVLAEPFQLHATATSSLPITYTSENENVATIQDNIVTIVGVGSTKITASQPGDASFNAAASVERMLVVNKESQSITFAPIASKTVHDLDFHVSASATSNLEVTFESSNQNVATVDGDIITIVGVGSTTITASQAGNEFYQAANPVLRTLEITKVNQTITFDAIPNKNVGDPNFSVAASSSSGLPVTIESTNHLVVTISGNIVSIVGPGIARLVATQTGNSEFNPAQTVEKEFTVKAHQTISFDALPAKTFGNLPFQLTATATSGLGVIFESSDPSLASIDGTVVTILHAGTVEISAKQPGSDIYHASPAVVRTLTINKGSQQINFGSISTKTLGDAPFEINATSTASLPINYASSDPAIAQINGKTVTLLKSGSVTITASQDGSNDIQGATSVARTFCVNPPRPVITANFENSDSPVLISTAPSGNQWYRNDQAIPGATSATHLVNAEGQYQVVATIGSCGSEFSEKFRILITDIPLDETEIHLYPNPASDYIILQGLEKNAFANTISASGVNYPLQLERMPSGEARISLKQLSPGVYTLQLRQTTGIHHFKFVKN